MKEWKSPELTVLVRSNSEEAVLTACKFNGYGGSSPDVDDEACNILCDACQVMSTS
jgi:hypothetical protein